MDKLRNSKAVNRPFQSPLRSNFHSSPCSKNLITPEKRIRHQPKLVPKKICQESREPETETVEKGSVDEADLKIVRQRISAKKRELEHLQRQLMYKKKHGSEDLKNLTERWLRGCQEALNQFQKDITQHGGRAVEMIEILSQLGIPPELVQYSVEDCDFV